MSPSAHAARLARSSDASKDATTLNESLWTQMDTEIRSQWANDTSKAAESEIRNDSSHQLLFLPFPYVSPTAPGSIYRFMFAWDTDFISRALIAHEVFDQVRNHISNYLSMIDRYGFMPNANAAGMTTRSQTPLIADTVWRYYLKTRNRDVLYQAYPGLKINYTGYWNAPHHQTPTGLATNRDMGDPNLPPNLAAEAEVGFDWTPIYAGDVRRCVPLVTNCALVRYARTLAEIAHELGQESDAASFTQEASRRIALIRQYCWSDKHGSFLEYDFVSGRQLPCFSDSALWTLWAGVADRAQAKDVVGNLYRIEHTFGLSSTDIAYPLPCPEKDYGSVLRLSPDGNVVDPDKGASSIGGDNPLQWMYPAGWAPSHLIAVEGLDAYGYTAEGMRIASKFLGVMLNQYERTGHLWEKYNVVDGSLILPNARCGNIWMRGWTAAAAALLGRRVFKKESLYPA